MQYNKSVEYLKSKIGIEPKCAIILGTGLSALADSVTDKVEILYEDIPGFVRSTAPSHKGLLIAGKLGNVPVLVFNGRFHYYEGYTMSQVVYPVRVARLLGVKTLFVTNAAGSLNIDLEPGDLVRIKDHINFMGNNPLIGSTQLDEEVMIDGVMTDEFGERFPSMHNPYHKDLEKIALIASKDTGVSYKEGVYVAVSGPMLETKAECIMLKSLGADLVGMSTVPEVIAAVHCGMKVFAMSVVTNLSNIFHSNAHTQEEIRENAGKAGQNLIKLIKYMCKEV
jgi:purine-nucleoside phosphorylase